MRRYLVDETLDKNVVDDVILILKTSRTGKWHPHTKMMFVHIFYVFLKNQCRISRRCLVLKCSTLSVVQVSPPTCHIHPPFMKSIWEEEKKTLLFITLQNKSFCTAHLLTYTNCIYI